jgi:predicted CXXCH cytochrome family protein
MRNILKTLFVVALVVPTLASAAITGSKHDLSSGSANTVRATTETQICKFCHAAHQASSQALLWNHTFGTVTGFPAGAATVGGTNLQTALPAASPSRACLACHDGTIALGSLTQQGGIQIAGLAAVIGTAGRVNLGNGANNGDHPISVPMPVAAGNAAYAGTTQGANVNFADFKAVATAQTAGIRFFGTPANGVECGSCHDVHNGTAAAANLYFLRVTQTGSQICLACHTK